MFWALKVFFRLLVRLPMFLVSPVKATRAVFKREKKQVEGRDWIDTLEDYDSFE